MPKLNMQGKRQPVMETKLLDMADKFNPKFIDRYFIRHWLLQHRIEVDKFVESRYFDPDDRVFNAAKIYDIEYPLNMVMGYLLVKDFMRKNRDKWSDIIDKVLMDAYVSIMWGRKGGGKTAQCAEICDEVHRREPDKPIYWLESNMNLPKWIESATRLEQVPDNSLVIGDESSILASSRSSMTEYNKSLGMVLAIARHQNLRVIFCTQHLNVMDVNIYRFSDCWFVKQMQMTEGIDLQKARQGIFFNYVRLMQPTKINQTLFTDGNQWTLFESGLPDWWSDEVSKGWGKLDKEQATKLIRDEYQNNNEVDTKMLKLRLKTRGVNLSEEQIEEIGLDALAEEDEGSERQKKRKSHK